MAKAMKFGSGKAKRYDEGGEIEVPEAGTGLKKETFKEAFKRARDRNAPDFEYNGKKYTTEYKEEKAARKAAALDKKPNESAAETARLSRAGRTESKSKAKAKDEDDISAPGTKIGSPTKSAAMESRGKAGSAGRIEPHFSQIKDVNPRSQISGPKSRGGGGGGGGGSRQLMLGSELDPKATMRSNRGPRDDDESRFADEGNPNFKRGGKVKKMASGGMARSASARADGCAIRGKTRA
jgi:hypothetical protein